MHRIVFLAVNASHAHSGHAAWLLRGAAPAHAWEWTTLETTLREAHAPVLERALACRPDVLAATFYLFNRAWLTEFLARFRVLSPGTVVIGGGPEWLGETAAFFAPTPLVDAGVRGEGEQAFRRWLTVWDRPGDWGAIPGLVWRAADGRVHDDGREADLPEESEIVSPYTRELAAFARPFVQLETMRGCGGACEFCTSGRRGGVRYFSEARVAADLAAIRRAGVREVRVLDRTFNEDESRCERMLDLLRTEYPEGRFHLELDPARVTPRLAAALRRFAPGRLHVEAGVQSLEEAALRAAARRGTAAETRAGLQLLRDVPGLAVHADLMAGLPGGTWPGLVRDLTELTLAGVDEIQLETVKVLPGTRLDGRLVRHGMTAAPRPPYEVLRTPAFDLGAMARAGRLSRVTDWYYNEPALRGTVQKACAAIPGFWEGLEQAVFACESWRDGLSLTRRYSLLNAYLASGAPALQGDLTDSWYRHDSTVHPDLGPAHGGRGAIPADATREEGDGAGPYDRIVSVGAGPARYYAYRTDATGRRRLAAVYRAAGPGVA